MKNKDPFQTAKMAAGHAAAKLVQNGMLVGLGTGSTANYFIEALIERCRKEHLSIRAVATSERSASQALAGGIPLVDANTITSLDLTVDGADEIDHHKRMIKGGGGALLREKIVASMSRDMVVVIDETKLVDNLGGFPLPLEIVPFAHKATLHKICHLGYNAGMRLNREGQLYVTDNGNYIIDIAFSGCCESPEEDQAILKAIPGVLETGFFFNLAKQVIVGRRDGTVEIIP